MCAFLPYRVPTGKGSKGVDIAPSLKLSTNARFLREAAIADRGGGGRSLEEAASLTLLLIQLFRAAEALQQEPDPISAAMDKAFEDKKRKRICGLTQRQAVPGDARRFILGTAESTGRPRMTRKGRSRLVLTGPQTNCLVVLRNRDCSQPKIAIEAKLDMKKTAAALRKLAELGLAGQNDSKLWLATARGKTCRLDTIRGRPRQNARSPGPGAQRLLDLLDRPMHGSAIVRKLGISRQRVRQLLLSLHSLGRVAFGDPDNPSWIVRRADDRSPILSYDDECLLSVLPREHATDVKRLRVAARLSEHETELSLGNLIAAGLVASLEGLRGNRLFRLTAAGLEHPQYVQSGRRAPPPRLPVQSERVHKVLQAISDAGVLRIRDVKNVTKIPHPSVNALIQYLKRKQLVAKEGHELNAPYSLTDQGRGTLAEMTPGQAA
jgi:hypothetical protein